MENQREVSLLTKARDLYSNGQYSKAMMILEELVASNAEHVDAYFYMANIFHIKGQIGKAIKAFHKVLELDPCHTDASISLSVLLNDIGRYEEAKKVFETANDNVKSQKEGLQDPHINKKFSAKHFELAEMYFSYNRYEEALFEYNKAYALDPEGLETRIKIAKVYSKKGYVSKAIEELKKLKSEFPGFIQARIALGLLYYGNGNTLEAQTEWQNALNKEPENPEAKMYLNLSKGATETSLHM